MGGKHSKQKKLAKASEANKATSEEPKKATDLGAGKAPQVEEKTVEVDFANAAQAELDAAIGKAVQENPETKVAENRTSTEAPVDDNNNDTQDTTHVAAETAGKTENAETVESAPATSDPTVAKTAEGISASITTTTSASEGASEPNVETGVSVAGHPKETIEHATSDDPKKAAELDAGKAPQMEDKSVTSQDAQVAQAEIGSAVAKAVPGNPEVKASEKASETAPGASDSDAKIAKKVQAGDEGRSVPADTTEASQQSTESAQVAESTKVADSTTDTTENTTDVDAAEAPTVTVAAVKAAQAELDSAITKAVQGNPETKPKTVDDVAEATPKSATAPDVKQTPEAVETPELATENAPKAATEVEGVQASQAGEGDAMTEVEPKPVEADNTTTEASDKATSDDSTVEQTPVGAESTTTTDESEKATSDDPKAASELGAGKAPQMDDKSVIAAEAEAAQAELDSAISEAVQGNPELEEASVATEQPPVPADDTTTDVTEPATGDDPKKAAELGAGKAPQMDDITVTAGDAEAAQAELDSAISKAVQGNPETKPTTREDA
ncbi:hypothetical protein SARC_10562 [Sphaeroforma arctica JP610]|uniref:Uncharacterized protein n=1 Tax=Sphaeroforma arctica JP610 TaxID=667725 RepID=A0A0L0FJK3_9EUKA|nr:hypothetical protein SARC_10562 [Sphaeroforma arctica JP610]KNC76962.1 hypothetical protein SARC_10562 [Sphaeroforma arctica JP610]|eukprot:XP_014150864.1 hypothetical protein SARC_10562 [Sphaeroforma arctica JP610]